MGVLDLHDMVIGGRENKTPELICLVVAESVAWRLCLLFVSFFSTENARSLPPT
jgi:hypothetical protein